MAMSSETLLLLSLMPNALTVRILGLVTSGTLMNPSLFSCPVSLFVKGPTVTRPALPVSGLSYSWNYIAKRHDTSGYGL